MQIAECLVAQLEIEPAQQTLVLTVLQDVGDALFAVTRVARCRLGEVIGRTGQRRRPAFAAISFKGTRNLTEGSGGVDK